MPRAKVQDIELYYEIHGKGYPIVLIRGLGSNADHWYRQVPVLSSTYKVITFDNRGIGRSDTPDGPYTIPMMAEDTLGLMDTLGISKAHILALSMGGMIAQEIALKYPEKVNGLVLACTHCGGDHAVSASEEIVRIFAEFIFTGSQEAAQKAVKCLFAEHTMREAPEVVQQYQEVSGKFPPATEVLVRQLEAVRDHNTWEDLPNIKTPTFILTGDEDVLVPPENSRILAERIPGARLQVIEKGGHQFLVEQAGASNGAVLEFLKALSPVKN